MQHEMGFFDKLCLGLDQALKTLTNQTSTTGRSYPAKTVAEVGLSQQEQKHAAALMRINHVGEICAQALYHGQALVSHSSETKEHMQQAALEEGDHLAWCKQRLDELHDRTSYLNPIWYAGSFCIGMIAGWVGDDWSLGFVAETEKQVIAHLEKHLNLLPAADERSKAILAMMEKDEAQHRDQALQSGARQLPVLVQKLMGLSSKVMVKTAYWM